jgi:hypothetical protein
MLTQLSRMLIESDKKIWVPFYQTLSHELTENNSKIRNVCNVEAGWKAIKL